MRRKLFLMVSLCALGLAGCSNEEQDLGTDVVPQNGQNVSKDVLSLITDFQGQVSDKTKSRAGGLIVDACEKKTYTVSTGAMTAARSISSLPDSTQIDIHYVKFHQDTISGFAIASSDPRVNRVYAFVEAGNIEDTASVVPLKWAIDKIPGIAAEDIKMYYEGPQSRVAFKDVFIAPLIKTKWDQAAPYNRYIAACSSNIGDPYYGHCPAGCVPIALAQVIAYCQRFKGTYYGNRNIDFATLTSVPSIDRTSTSDIANQAATFVHEVAMYCQVKFTCEAGSSQLKDGYQYLKELGYTCTYKEGGLDINALYINLHSGKPHLSAGVKGNSGHAWIVDGMKATYNGGIFTEVTVHCNWGLRDIHEGWVADYRQPVDGYTFNKENRQVYITNN